MEYKLKKLLLKARGASPKTSAILLVEKEDSKGNVLKTEEIEGVSISNACLRDTIRAEEIAIARAIAKGYKMDDLTKLYIMTSSSSISDLKYLKKAIITKHMKDSKEVEIMTKYGKSGILKVSDLKSDILDKVE